MSRTRALNSVARDIVCSFVSHNNQVNGKYFFNSLENTNLPLTFDLVAETIEPPYKPYHDVVKRYAHMLCDQIECRKLAYNIVSAAKLIIENNKVTLTLIDYRGGEHQFSETVTTSPS